MDTKVFYAAAALAVTLAGAANAQTLETMAASRRFRGEDALDVKVRFGLGDFTLTRDQGAALYRASITHDHRFDPILEYSRDSQSLEVGIDSPDELRLGNLRDIHGQRIDLSVSPTVPVDLDFEFGAGEAELDLGGLTLERVGIQTGASETVVIFSRPTLQPCERFDVEVGAAELRIEELGNSNCAMIEVGGAAGSLLLDFAGEWQHEGITHAEVNIGLGGLTLRFPTNLGVSIEVKRFLASFDADGFRRQGDRYVSSNYDDARSRLHLALHAIVGDIEVEWLPGR